MNVDIKLLNQGTAAYRILPFVKTIIKYGHRVQGTFDYEFDDACPIYLIEYVGDINVGQKRSVIELFNDLENKMISYRGKIIFFSLCDNSSSPFEGLKPSILNRIDAWFIHAFYENGGVFRTSHICPLIKHKYIVLPMFNSFYMQCSPQVKKSQIYFKGYYHHNRVQIFKKILNDPLLRKHFNGGLMVPEGFQDSELQSFFYTTKIPNEHILQEMGSCNLTLCPRGHVRWCHRHIEAMSCQNSIISNDLTPDVDFLYKFLINKYLYIFADDLSDLENICRYALLNNDETINRARKLHEIYESYFSLNPDDSYKDSTWNPLKLQLESLGIFV